MENYINPIQKGLLVTEILQEWRFGSSHQTKNHEQIRCLLRAKEIQNEFWKTTVINTSYNHNTSHRNQDRNCHESVFFILFWISVSSVTQSCLTLCEPMDCSIQGFPVHHQLPELAQTHVYQVDDASQPSHPLSSPSPPAFNLPSIRVFSNESVLCVRWPKYWSFSFSMSPSNEYSGLISFRIDLFDLLAVQGTLKSLIQHHSSKASILQHSAFFMVQLSHWYMTTGKTTALTRHLSAE